MVLQPAAATGLTLVVPTRWLEALADGPLAAALALPEIVGTLGVALGALGNGIRLWLTYAAGMMWVRAVVLGTLALAATWVGLIGVFGSDNVLLGTAETTAAH